MSRSQGLAIPLGLVGEEGKQRAVAPSPTPIGPASPQAPREGHPGELPKRDRVPSLFRQATQVLVFREAPRSAVQLRGAGPSQHHPSALEDSSLALCVEQGNPTVPENTSRNTRKRLRRKASGPAQ